MIYHAAGIFSKPDSPKPSWSDYMQASSIGNHPPKPATTRWVELSLTGLIFTNMEGQPKTQKLQIQFRSYKLVVFKKHEGGINSKSNVKKCPKVVGGGGFT